MVVTTRVASAPVPTTRMVFTLNPRRRSSLKTARKARRTALTPTNAYPVKSATVSREYRSRRK